MNHPFFIQAIIYVVCLALRFVYEHLKEAEKIKPESKPVFAIIFTVMCVLWTDWFILCLSDPFRVIAPAWVHWIGFGLFILGTISALGAFIQLRGVENIQHLVTTGLFKKFRHPMYNGFILWIVGWSIYHGAIVSLSIGLMGIGSVLWWRHLEEQRLEIQFDEAYKQYRLTSWF